MRFGFAVVAALLPACLPELNTTVDEAEILGGTNVPAGKWTDVASVREDGQGSCTGTLIAPTVVLTAGHCEPGINSVLVGTTSTAREAEGEVITIVNKVPYNGSASAAFNSADLTVTILARESKFEPRAIATGWARYDIKNGAKVHIVGYGAIDAAGEMYVPDLREATTTITDAGCETSAGCRRAPIKPNGELGAGGMGIDTCYGDSGGPLYLDTPYGMFLAGVTSRGYDDNQLDCSEGGIYVRPDKFVDWIEQVAGVPVRRGPAPSAEAIRAVRGNAGEVDIVHNDPKSDSHSYAIKTPPMYGTAAVRDDGRVRVCTNDNVAGGDSMVVTVTDKNDPTRAEDVKIAIFIDDGDPGSNCDPNAFGEDGGGGCCDSGRSAGGALPLSLAVLAFLVRRRRR